MKSIIIYISLLTFIAINACAQKATIKRADKKYEQYAYIDAIETYERIAAKGYKSIDMFQKLGNSYYFNAKLEKAAKWYGELFAMTQDVDREYYYRYAQCLKSIGNHPKSAEMLAIFHQKFATDLRGQLFENNSDYLADIKANSGRYQIEDAGINSVYSDYGSSFLGNKLIFTSARDTGNFIKRKHKWNNQYFTDIYSSEISIDGNQNTPKKFSKQFNTRFYDATPIFTKDGKIMYFTKNNLNNERAGKNTASIMLFKIYKASLINKKWTNIIELPFNSNQYSVAHPALSPDEKTLYFASDMPGTIGQSDLFKVTINEDGSYGNPENLGSNINTEGRETFPFVSAENELYFASDGHPGLGGLDIFVSKIKMDGTLNEVKNIGEPANSGNDDFGYLVDSKTNTGYLTSNRVGGKGSDDIYKFIEIKKLICDQELFGLVSDLDTNEIITNAKIDLYDDRYHLINTTASDDKGNYSFEVDCEKSYYVRGEKEAYETKEQKITIAKESGRTELPILLEKKIKAVTNGDDLAKTFGIKNIYFDFDQSIIRKDAAYELEKILDVMEKNPTMKIDIRSHTDSRGTSRYNENLSKRRAKSTIAWLINNGIDKSRLTGKGYGERELVNKCTDKVHCDKAAHQENRRSEFIIIYL